MGFQICGISYKTSFRRAGHISVSFISTATIAKSHLFLIFHFWEHYNLLFYVHYYQKLYQQRKNYYKCDLSVEWQAGWVVKVIDA